MLSRLGIERARLPMKAGALNQGADARVATRFHRKPFAGSFSRFPGSRIIARSRLLASPWEAMAFVRRSPFTVTGSPGILTRFPIVRARAALNIHLFYYKE